MFIKLKEGLTINSDEISSYEYNKMKQTVITMKSVYEFSGDFGTTNHDYCMEGDITDKLDKLLKAVDINYEHKQCPIIVENLKSVSELLDIDNEIEKEVLQKGDLKDFYISECETMEEYEKIQNILFELDYEWIESGKKIMDMKKEYGETQPYDIGHWKINNEGILNNEGRLSYNWNKSTIDEINKSRQYTPQEFIELHKHLLDKE